MAKITGRGLAQQSGLVTAASAAAHREAAVAVARAVEEAARPDLEPEPDADSGDATTMA